MDTVHKKILKGIVLEIRHLLEGRYDAGNTWHPGDLEQRLASIGVRRNREPVPIDELAHLSDIDKRAREVVDAYLTLRKEAGIELSVAVDEFVRETAYTWANRFFALRCMEARELIDEVILQKEVYGGRSLEHHRLAQRQPELCSGEDDGLFAVLDKVFEERAVTLPLLFDPKAPGVALKPTASALKGCVGMLSGIKKVNGQGLASDDVFNAPDALGWTYQYWNTEEKDRVFEKVRTKKGAKIEGADIIPATQLYTEPYMVKFLVQNSLGATWAGMRPDTKLIEEWEYFVRDADRTPVEKKPIREITFLDPACGSGHFLIEAFDLFYTMYEEEGQLTGPDDICRSILEKNLFGIDIDERAVQIAEAALWMKAAEKAFDFVGAATNLVPTNIRLPKRKDHLEEFLKKHPEDKPIRPALEVIFEGLAHADELGSLLQIEEPVERELKHLKQMHDLTSSQSSVQRDLFRATVVQDQLPFGIEGYDDWRTKTVAALKEHFAAEVESADLGQAFFGQSVGMGLALFDLLAQRYDVVAANPPYMHNRNMGSEMRSFLKNHYDGANLDLYAAFLHMCLQFSKNGAFAALVSQQSFMFVASYKSLRSRILINFHIYLLAHLGPRAFEEIAGEKVNTALVVFQNQPDCSLVSSFIRLVDSRQKATNLKNPDPNLVFKLHQNDFLNIPAAPIIYWITPEIRNLFSEEPCVGSIMKVANRTKTGNNDKFLRYMGSDRM